MLIDINYCTLQHKCKAYAKEIYNTLLRIHLHTCSVSYEVLLLTHSVSYYVPMVHARQTCCFPCMHYNNTYKDCNRDSKIGIHYTI